MKIAKLISLIVFCIMQVNVIFCQMVTKNERIIWNTIPDSILLSSGLFNNSSFDENYNTLVFTNRYSLPKHNYNVSFSNIEYTAAEDQEISFLEQRGVVLTDSIQYTFSGGIICSVRCGRSEYYRIRNYSLYITISANVW